MAAEKLINVMRGLPVDGAVRASASDGEVRLYVDGNAQDLINATYHHGFRTHENFLPSQGRIGLNDGQVINTISDADMCEGAILQLDHILEQSGRPCFNPPEALRRARRDRLSAEAPDFERTLLPRTVRVSSPEEAEAADIELDRPLLLRPAGSHTGEGLVKLADGAGLAAQMETPSRTGTWHLTEFIDCAGGGVYSKLRLAVIGERIIPRHCLRSREWMVHAQERTAEDIEIELAYLERVQAQIEGGELEDVTRLAGHLGLDYFGVDLGVLDDGRFVLFEANPAMRILDPSKSHQAKFLPLLEEIEAALLDHLRAPAGWRRAERPV